MTLNDITLKFGATDQSLLTSGRTLTTTFAATSACPETLFVAILTSILPFRSARPDKLHEHVIPFASLEISFKSDLFYLPFKAFILNDVN